MFEKKSRILCLKLFKYLFSPFHDSLNKDQNNDKKGCFQELTINCLSGIINYEIFAATTEIGPQSEDGVGCSVKLLDKEGDHITSAMGCVGTIKISNASLWWPYLMHSNPGYMYTLMVCIFLLLLIHCSVGLSIQQSYLPYVYVH